MANPVTRAAARPHPKCLPKATAHTEKVTPQPKLPIKVAKHLLHSIGYIRFCYVRFREVDLGIFIFKCLNLYTLERRIRVFFFVTRNTRLITRKRCFTFTRIYA